MTLTERQLEVLQLAARGYSNSEMAAELYKSLDTVKTHKKRALRALGAKNITHAVAVGYEIGILRPTYLQHPALDFVVETMRKGESA